MNILLLHSKPEIRDMLAFPLESQLSATTFGSSNAQEAQTILAGKGIAPDIIIAENTPDTQQLLTSWKQDTPYKVILCDDAEGTAPSLVSGTFLGFALYSDLVNNLLNLIKKEPAAQTEDKSAEDKNNKYCRINTSLLLKTTPLAADIYIQLSPKHFVKLFQQNDEFNENDLSRYRDQKKVIYLHLLKEDCNLFTKKLLEELSKMLSASPPPSTQTSSETVENAVETVHELIQKVGVTPEVQELVKESVKVAMKAMGDFPQLSEVLKVLNDPHSGYIGRHTMLLMNVACAMAVCMDWYSEATFEKLSMAAFLHDAALNNHELCAVKDLSEFEKKYKGKFTQAQVQEYKTHPERALLMLGMFKEVPAEVDKIIAQHHEHPMGTGFPNQLASNYITPLSSLFIVAHDLTDYIIDRDGKFDIDEFLEENAKKYSSGNFKKIAKQLSEVELF